MKNLRKFSGLALLYSLVGFLGAALCAYGAELDAVERSGVGPLSQQALHPATDGMHIIAVPILVSNKMAIVTIVDSAGHPVGGVSMLINGDIHDADAHGSVYFKVPNSGAVSLVLQTDDKQDVDTRRFVLGPGGLLTSAEVAPFTQLVVAAQSLNTKGPFLFLAPSVVEPAERFVLLGANLEASGSFKVMLDGLPAAVVSASPVAVIATVPTHASVGPIKQIYVTSVDGAASNILEVDVAKSEVSYDDKDLVPGRDIDARILVYGTSLPGIVQISNHQQDVALVLADGTALGERIAVLVPGGDPNALPAKLRLSRQSHRPAFDAKLLADGDVLVAASNKSQQSPGGSFQVPNSLWRSLYQVQLMKLKRRLIAVQQRLGDEKCAMQSTDAAKTFDVDKVTTGLKALSIRQDALSTAINARKRLFSAMGGTEVQFQKAMDDASGEAYYVLESQARDVQLVPLNPVVASSTAITIKPISQISRRLFRALAEPKMKLLPPLDMDSVPAGQAPMPGFAVSDLHSNVRPVEPSVPSAGLSVKAPSEIAVPPVQKENLFPRASSGAPAKEKPAASAAVKKGNGKSKLNPSPSASKKNARSESKRVRGGRRRAEETASHGGRRRRDAAPAAQSSGRRHRKRRGR